MPSELLTDRRGHTLVLTISDPGTRNTLSPQVYAAAVEVLSAFDSDAELRCVILRGEGAHFCAGGDLNRLAASRAGPIDAVRSGIDRFHTFVQAIRLRSPPAQKCAPSPRRITQRSPGSESNALSTSTAAA